MEQCMNIQHKCIKKLSWTYKNIAIAFALQGKTSNTEKNTFLHNMYLFAIIMIIEILFCNVYQIYVISTKLFYSSYKFINKIQNCYKFNDWKKK